MVLLGGWLLRRRLLATVLLMLHARRHPVFALKDGLDAQLFPCDPLNVRQRWRLDQGSSSGGSGAGGGAGHLHLIWTGVDPPLTQTLVHLADGVGPHPREVQGGQLTTWSLHGAHPPCWCWHRSHQLQRPAAPARLFRRQRGRSYAE